MKIHLLHIILRSLVYHRKAVISQVMIIAILAAVITGSLLTGYSVRKSLRNTAFSRMGNTTVLISSGLRYFDPSLAERFSEKSGKQSVALTELEGFCQNFKEGNISKKVRIYGTDTLFFRFHGKDSIAINKGEVAVNRNLANQIRVSQGDEIILRIRNISDIPSDAPFSTGAEEGRSAVFKIGRIIDPEDAGDFSLGINQIVPSNIFIRNEDLINFSDQKKIRPNRLLLMNTGKTDIAQLDTVLKNTIQLRDIGLKLRKVAATGENEIVSDRIFIDRFTLDDIKKSIPDASPVLTYLANSIESDSGETPYSFVSAVPSTLYKEISGGEKIIINNWLSEDIKATAGDTLKLTWYSPDSINQLKEKSARFVVIKVVEMDSIWNDRMLMPDFPGISGSESCSEWDAGVPIKTSSIRKKDEDYWDKYKGTPKAFISHEAGEELWGNNYGPATAVRFPAEISEEEIKEKLHDAFDPERSGFIISDLRKNATDAAGESVDFGTLFLSLGFFILLASLLLLSLSASSYFNTKKSQVATYFYLGFSNKFINRLLFLETALISVLGSFAGSLLGLLVNNYIIGALNSVWKGAVQTDTLTASAGITPIVAGFMAALTVTLLFFYIKTATFLKVLRSAKSGAYKLPSLTNNLYLLVISSLLFAILFAVSLIVKKLNVSLSFAAGTLLLITLILFLRHYFIGGIRNMSFSGLARLYYRHNPSNAIAPAIFIAAGIFALFITSLNHMDFNKSALDPSGGTGGYLLWAETSVPVTDDLSTEAGKSKFGLDEDDLTEMNLLQLAMKEGDDASCLNLNHVQSPPLLGVDASNFIRKKSFSFASVINGPEKINPWKMLSSNPGRNTIYGIADQTVLEWGLKIKTGDTLIIRSESGQPLNIIIAAGLKSSVFQGNVLVDEGNLKKYFPSVSGSSVFLIDGDASKSNTYQSILSERFANYGITTEPATVRLAKFYQVTNTYLSVFTVLGVLGMILGIFGLGFILMRNYNFRKQEFALLSATGFSLRKIRRSLLSDLLIIMSAGIFTGALSALTATLPSLQANANIPWKILIFMTMAVFFTGIAVLLVSVRTVRRESLVSSLRKD